MPPPTAAELARQHEIKLNDLRKDVDVLAEKLDQVKLIELRERLAVLEAHVAELKKSKDESEKRHWQFVYIFAGAMASLLVTVVVQLILLYLKKP